jgi:hypothetical protein
MTGGAASLVRERESTHTSGPRGLALLGQEKGERGCVCGPQARETRPPRCTRSSEGGGRGKRPVCWFLFSFSKM